MRICNSSNFRLIASGIALSLLSFGTACDPGESNLASINQASILDTIAHPSNLSTSDLNGDGVPDISVGQFLGFNLAFRLNKGDGTFHNTVRYYSGVQPTSIEAQDFNMDGNVDVAVTNFGSSNVSIFMGQGAGAFAPAQHYSISNPYLPILGLAKGPSYTISGDFNHDGKLDLATGNAITNNISFLPGRGDGTFGPAKTIPVLGGNSIGGLITGLGSGDFDEDGKLDLAAGTIEGLIVLRGQGDGTFNAYMAHHSGLVLACLHIADFNADGHLDIATTAFGTSNFSILLGDGHGSFTLAQSEPSGGIASECFGVGDLNGDGKLDLALVNTLSTQGASNVVVQLGRGDGTFCAGASRPTGLASWSASIVDFNHDGKADVAVANGVNSSVSILFGNGDGTIQPMIMYPM